MKGINLISDTVTKPTPEMLAYMFKAEVGDDVFGEDPSINRLEQKMATMFGKESAVFCPSGTMSNQIAIKMLTQPMDDMICDIDSHVYQFEGGGFSFNAGISVSLIQGLNGKIRSEQILSAIKAEQDWLPRSRLVVIENSCNKGGGSYYTLEEMQALSKTCKEKGLKIHLDGARLFNVLVETGNSPAAVGDCFDSVSICFSKGLGAPVGSILIGSNADIKKARRIRKILGGGMRQAGYLAAACEYAIDNHVDRLKIDNARAKTVGEVLGKLNYVTAVKNVMTNILIFDLRLDISTEHFLQFLKLNGILAVAFGPNTIRFVFHLDIETYMIRQIIEVLQAAPF